MCSQNRSYFPRGLKQPEKGHRFAVDSLLLACLPEPGPGSRVLELGSGCGVVSLGLVLANPGLDLQVLGLDLDRELTACARENAGLLGLEASCEFRVQDIRQLREQRQLGPESFDLVLANPPFRQQGRGRSSPSQKKTRARQEAQAGLEEFLHQGCFALKNKGQLGLLYTASRLDHLLQLLPRYRLAAKSLRLVHGRVDSPAGLALVMARKNGGPGLEVQPPLFLYTLDRSRNRLTRQARQFCPFLGHEQG
ncbi:MAG: tRNA1(Val) (adenine(37)-N6)-methyltransferase [Desulfohalobiaceae bacterium]